MEYLGYSQEYLYAQIRLLQHHCALLSYANSLHVFPTEQRGRSPWPAAPRRTWRGTRCSPFSAILSLVSLWPAGSIAQLPCHPVVRPVLSPKPAASEARTIRVESRYASRQEPPGWGQFPHRRWSCVGDPAVPPQDATCWASGMGTVAPNGSIFRPGQSSLKVPVLSCGPSHASWAVSGKKSSRHRCTVS